VTVAGIDFSTKAIDVALLDDDTDQAVWYRFPLAHGKGHLALARSVSRVVPPRSWWEEHGVWLVGVEDPMSRFPHVAKALGVVAGALLARMPLELPVVQTEPSEWQGKFLALAKLPADRKTAIRARTLEAMPHLSIWPQDAFDAYGIAWATRKLNADAIARVRA
jgi:hypothetical protein